MGESASVKKSSKKNQDLFFSYKADPSKELRNEIVGKHMYLADIITKKFINRGVEYEDVYQIASIALIKAVERFDPEKGVKFVSFATPTILGEIKRYFRDKGSLIRIPRRIYEAYQKVSSAKEILAHEMNRNPKVSEIAEYLKIREEAILEIIESWNAYKIKSFDQNVYEEDDIEFLEVLGEEDKSFDLIINRDFLSKSFNKLNEIEKKFIKMRYYDIKTQKEIAESMGVSQMYVSRLEKKVLQKFRYINNKK